jgi:hypothetical protein
MILQTSNSPFRKHTQGYIVKKPWQPHNHWVTWSCSGRREMSSYWIGTWQQPFGPQYRYISLLVALARFEFDMWWVSAWSEDQLSSCSCCGCLLGSPFLPIVWTSEIVDKVYPCSPSSVFRTSRRTLFWLTLGFSALLLVSQVRGMAYWGLSH